MSDLRLNFLVKTSTKTKLFRKYIHKLEYIVKSLHNTYLQLTLKIEDFSNVFFFFEKSKMRN